MRVTFSFALLALTGVVHADQGLEAITVVATGISTMSAASSGDVSQEQLLSQPLLRSAAVLESVPGLIVTQHSGEGKANQYFLRAFNLDHGTDLAVEVDDMPVNMPTHAHGQGYAELRYVRGIPGFREPSGRDFSISFESRAGSTRRVLELQSRQIPRA
jgi:hypothetical protein